VIRLTDDELRHLTVAAIGQGTAFTSFVYSLRARSFAISDRRARRVWDELGGPIQVKTRLYAPGTEPTEIRTSHRIPTNRGPNHWRSS
jgi:uncharacterized protein (DUF1778 family)